MRSPLHCIPDTIIGLLRPSIQGPRLRPLITSSESLGSNANATEVIRRRSLDGAKSPALLLPRQHHRVVHIRPAIFLTATPAIDEMSAL